MANLFLREPTYISISELKDTTSKNELQNLTDDELKVLIAKAEDTIDSYIGSYGVPFNEEQTLIFPVYNDGQELLPRDIKISTLYTIEQIYSNGDMIESAKDNGGDILEEKVGDRNVKYSEAGLNDNGAIQLGLPLQAIMLLKNYKQIFYKNKL